MINVDYAHNLRQQLIAGTPMSLRDQLEFLKRADLPMEEKRPLLIAVQQKIIARMPRKDWTSEPTVLGVSK